MAGANIIKKLDAYNFSAVSRHISSYQCNSSPREFETPYNVDAAFHHPSFANRVHWMMQCCDTPFVLSGLVVEHAGG
jgi:hypothetical protein